MYKNSFVTCIMHGGRILEETDRKVILPFGSEYKIRLINKHHKRCATDLLVNGEKVGRFVLHSGETADIERFLDGNLNSGAKFTFASLNDGRTVDKQNFENGVVEAHFFLEKDPEIRVVEHHHHHHDYLRPLPYKPMWPYGEPVWYTDTGGSSFHLTGGGGTTCSSSSSSPSSSSSSVCAFNCATDLGKGIEGSTVRGSESQQQFREISGLQFESQATILKLKIMAGEEIKVMGKYCSGCARKRRHGESFCATCGSRY